MKVRLIIAAGILLLGWSCKKSTPVPLYYYQIENHSDYRIKVVFYDFWYHREYYPNNGDSVVYYGPGEARDLLVVYNLNTYYSSPPENQDTLQGIHVLKIFRDDSIPITINPRLTKYWTYSMPDSHKAIYNLQITNNSFAP